MRLEIASQLLAGLLANPAVVAPARNGWNLVNVTASEIAAYAIDLADELIEADKPEENVS